MHKPKELQVIVPEEGLWLYRLLINPALGQENYWPNAGIKGKKRMWPGGEDWLSYLGISCWDDQEKALAQAEKFNPKWERKFGHPRWIAVGRFYVDGHRGHAYAWQPPIPGHHTAWGPSGEFFSSQDTVVPILP